MVIAKVVIFANWHCDAVSVGDNGQVNIYVKASKAPKVTIIE